MITEVQSVGYGCAAILTIEEDARPDPIVSPPPHPVDCGCRPCVEEHEQTSWILRQMDAFESERTP